MSLLPEKGALRRYAAALPKVEAPELAGRFLALPEVERAATVMAYWGVGWELDTAPLIGALLARGKRVALPRCLPRRGMEARAITGPEDLQAGGFGLLEPGEHCPVVPRQALDVILVPNVLCDRENYRLGQGGGYYDRFLAGYEGFTVCICPGERLVERLPREQCDVPVRLVVTHR